MTLTDWYVAGLALVAGAAIVLLFVQAGIIRKLRSDRRKAFTHLDRLRLKLHDLADYVNALEQRGTWSGATPPTPILERITRIPRAPAAATVTHLNPNRRARGAS